MATETTLQDQKKRTLEALERRFALAEAAVNLQQQKNKKASELHVQQPKRIKTSNDENESAISNVNPSATLTKASVTHSVNTSSRKGKYSFSGHAISQEVDQNDPTYSQLLQPVNENLLTASVEIPKRRGSVVDQVLHELLQNGDSAQKYMQGSRSLKFDNWILLDTLVQNRGTAARVKALQSHSKRSRKHMSMKQQKKCGSLDLPQELHDYDIFKPMHEIWKGYINQLLKSVGKNQLAQCLLSADLHGAIILVALCKNADLTGVRGIMIRETAETFGIITQDNKFRVVPKKLSVFIFQADIWKITLHGDKLISRS